MRKLMPCQRHGCGTAKLTDGPYVMQRMPAIFSSPHGRLKYKCLCGKMNVLSLSDFKSIPDTNLTVDGK